MTEEWRTGRDLMRAEARKRVEKQLDLMDGIFGPFGREELAAVMDGAQEAVAEWLPKQVRDAQKESQR